MNTFYPYPFFDWESSNLEKVEYKDRKISFHKTKNGKGEIAKLKKKGNK